MTRCSISISDSVSGVQSLKSIFEGLHCAAVDMQRCIVPLASLSMSNRAPGQSVLGLPPVRLQPCDHQPARQGFGRC